MEGAQAPRTPWEVIKEVPVEEIGRVDRQPGTDRACSDSDDLPRSVTDEPRDPRSLAQRHQARVDGGMEASQPLICASVQLITISKPCSRTGSPRLDKCPAVPSKRHIEGTADGYESATRGSVRDGQVSLDSLGLRRRLLFCLAVIALVVRVVVALV